VLQGGNELCRIEGFDRRKAVSELKVAVEAKAGLVPALTRLFNPESQVGLQDYLTLEDAGMPNEHALAAGVIELYVQKLKKVVVADELQIAPYEVTDSKLASLCDSIKDDATDILVLCGCRRIINISCLVQLSTISHLDISGCSLGANGGFHLACVIKDMGAMTSLNVSGNGLDAVGAKYIAEAIKVSKCKKMSDHWLNCFYCYPQDMGGILSVNLLKNRISVAQVENLVSILKEHPTLKSLCGNSRDETELDMSGKMKGATDAIMLVPEIVDNRALTKFDISNNGLGPEGAKALAVGLKGNRVITELNVSTNYFGINLSNGESDTSGVIAIADAIRDMGALSILNLAANNLGAFVLSKGWTEYYDKDEDEEWYGHTDGREQKDKPGKPEGIIAIANAIPDMGALTSLNLSSNNLEAEGGKIVAEAIKVNDYLCDCGHFGTIFMPI
jgi:hypothetical protein